MHTYYVDCKICASSRNPIAQEEHPQAGIRTSNCRGSIYSLVIVPLIFQINLYIYFFSDY